MKCWITMLLIIMLFGCGPAIHTTDQNTLNCITLQNHQTRWSALSKGLAVMAGFLPAVGLPWAIGAVVGSLSAGSSVMADGDYSDYLLYGCPTIKSAITSTK